MNAAAKAIHQSNLFNGSLAEIHLSRQLRLALVLLLATLFSALAIIYITNKYRINVSVSQQLEQQAQQLQLQWGQLLLEQASLSAPSRVAAVAVKKLHMHLPRNQDTYVLQAK